jgi:lactoylglutathione lyase
MYIEHLAIWCKDLEAMKDFYVKYFGAVANKQYHNPRNQFYSYFLNFEKGPRLELMQMPRIPDSLNDVMEQFMGLIHFAVSVGSEEKVNTITEQFRKDGIRIVGEPRKTGDGYYESAILDIEGNRIEITV